MGIYKIAAKSAPIILFPSNAVEARFWERPYGEKFQFIGTDDVIFEPEFLHTWRKISDDELNECSTHYFDMPAETMKSLWIGRLGYLDDCWHLIRMK